MFEKIIGDMMSKKESNLAKFVKHDIALESKVAKKTAAAYEGIEPDHEHDSEEKQIKKLEEDFPRREEEEMNAPVAPARREEEEPEPHKDGEEEENALGNDKEYFGDKEDDFFYLETSTEEGESDLRVVDAEGKVVYSAKENNLDSTDVFHFILQAVPEIQPDNVSSDIFMRYIKPKIEELEKEREQEEDGGFGGDEPMVSNDSDPMNRRPRESKTNLAELKVVFDDHEFTVNLLEDDSRDTVVEINGKQFRFDQEFASMYYDEAGVLTEDGLRELAEQILSSLDDRDYEELTPAATRTEEKVDLPFELDKVLDEVNLVTQGVKTLRRDAKAAMKNKDYAAVAQLTGQLATIHGALPEVDPEPDEAGEATEAKEEVEESVNEINVVTQGIKQLARATKDALKGGDYASAAQFANSLATIHGALPELPAEENADEGIEPDEDKDSEESTVKKLEEEDVDEKYKGVSKGTIKDKDVGKSFSNVFGGKYLGQLGKIAKVDIGKQVFDDDGQLYIENAEQRDKRLGSKADEGIEPDHEHDSEEKQIKKLEEEAKD